MSRAPVKKPSLEQQREILLRRSQLLREQISGQSRQLAPKVRVANKAFDAVGWLKGNPGLVIGVLGALLVLRPRKTVRMGLKAWGAWRLVSKVMPFVKIIQRLR